MVGHHRERNDLQPQSNPPAIRGVPNPVLAMLEVLAADGVLAAKEKRPGLRTARRMIEADFAVIDQIASWVRRAWALPRWTRYRPCGR